MSCFYNFLLKNKFNFNNIFILTGVLILASINIFYQSKLNILAFIICCCYIFLSNNNYKNKLKIISLVLLVTLPFIINYAYQKYYNKFAKEFNKREMYVSNIINLMIKDKLKVLTNQIKKNFKTTVLGTPEDYGLELTKFTLKK
jgi:hypothetical protein